MPNIIGPDDRRRLNDAAARFSTAEHAVDVARQAYWGSASDATKKAWANALVAQQRAWNDYWAGHKEYFVEMGVR